jgi:phosphatidylglycerophosphate synthase
VLVHLQRADVFVALIIIGREIAISALREWMAQIGASKSVAVHMLGKLKTTVQMVAIPFLLYDGHVWGLVDTGVWGTWLIWLSGRAHCVVDGVLPAKVNKTELIEHIAKHADISKAAATRALESMVGAVKTTLKKGGIGFIGRIWHVRSWQTRGAQWAQSTHRRSD